MRKILSKRKILLRGQLIVEILIAFGIATIILPALLWGFTTSREGKIAQKQRIYAAGLLKEAEEATRSYREADWNTFAVNGVYHPVVTSGRWALANGLETIREFTWSVTISDYIRNTKVDPSMKTVSVSVTWGTVLPSSLSSTLYLSRYLDDDVYSQSTQVEFNTGTLNSTQTTNTAGGEVILANNNKAKWCSPELSQTTIDLPDGPPVAVAASANSGSTAIPNNAYVATSPETGNSIKMAYVNVTANSDPPVATLRGTFTLDAAKYSNSGYVPTGIGLTNDFKTNDIKYYTSSSGKTYVLITTNLLDREVVAVQVNDGSGDAFQDPVNKIYKYWTFFNTKIYGPSTDINTGFVSPTANSVDTGGDNNGYDSRSTRAYSDNASFAVDTNSGNGTSADCSGTDKDRHRFYNYSFSIPGGSSISGIEVRLDAKADSISGSPKICTELSWNGGATWTEAKSTTALTTSEATYTLGGAADTWGHAWTDTNFTNANFRLRVTDVASDTARDFSLDWAAVKVYYSSGGAATNDQAPFGYGGISLSVLGDRGYVISSGYLYVFDLTNIDDKTSSNGLDMIGCRIELDGYDCLPGSGVDRKYSAGETGTSWSSTAWPVHNDCSDGGNIELYADNDIYPIQVDSNIYVYVAVGAGTNPEFDIVNVTSVPGGSTSPTISSSSCGRISGGNSGWKRISSLDFNTESGTEEAANSVFAKADGTRAYISSNGGIDANGDGDPDSYQQYVINTSNKSSPSFVSGGYYYGTGANAQLFPRRSLTVLNGQRMILVGRDAISDGNDAQEYQVLNIENENAPAYCGGINFDAGFNDLTSVSEADGDNFVYMVANTMDHQLKVIQGGPDTGIYTDLGTYESPTFDAGSEAAFNRFAINFSQPAATTLKFQIAGVDPVSGSCSGAIFDFAGPDLSAGSYFTTSSGQIPLDDTGLGYENPARCFRYKAYFSTLNNSFTPTLLEASFNYSP